MSMGAIIFIALIILFIIGMCGAVSDMIEKHEEDSKKLDDSTLEDSNDEFENEDSNDEFENEDEYEEKLVRDKMDSLYPADHYRFVENEEKYGFLLDKFFEEVDELEKSDFKDPQEFADVLTVLEAIAKHNGIHQSWIKDAVETKLKERGGFETGRIWIIK